MDILLQSPPPPPTTALPAPLQPGMNAIRATTAEGPSLKLPGPQPHSWRVVAPEAQTGVAVCPWAAVCTNLGHKSKLKINIL